MKYGKYVFNTKEQAEEKIADLSTTNEAGEVLRTPSRHCKNRTRTNYRSSYRFRR